MTLYTTDDVARMFQVDRRTIQRWAREQRIGHIRIGRRTIRFTQQQIDEALAVYQREKAEPRTDADLRNPGYAPTLTVVPIRRRA